MKIKEFKTLLKSKSSKRNFINSMTIGNADFFFWRPNNYRRQIVIKKNVNSIGKSTIAKRVNGSIAKHSKLLHVKGYSSNITIQLGKNKLTAIWSQNIIGGVKEIFKVSKSNLGFLDLKKKEIEEYIDKCLFDFCNKFNYDVASSPVWSRHEDFIHGESFIDSIPQEVIIHDEYFKKVYEKGIEAIGGVNVMPTEKIRLYIHNRMKEENESFRDAFCAALDEALTFPFDKQVLFVEKLNIILEKHKKLEKNNAY